jgi:hypothetical protein
MLESCWGKEVLVCEFNCLYKILIKSYLSIHAYTERHRVPFRPRMTVWMRARGTDVPRDVPLTRGRRKEL